MVSRCFYATRDWDACGFLWSKLISVLTAVSGVGRSSWPLAWCWPFIVPIHGGFTAELGTINIIYRCVRALALESFVSGVRLAYFDVEMVLCIARVAKSFKTARITRSMIHIHSDKSSVCLTTTSSYSSSGSTTAGHPGSIGVNLANYDVVGPE